MGARRLFSGRATVTKSRIRIRGDQIAELTRGIALPLPALSAAHLDVVLEALAASWCQLLEEHGCNLVTRDEIELNALMQARLNILVQNSSLLSQLVSAVVRGGEMTSFDGSRLEKRPDLAFYLTR
jgi:hypothetical protein